MIIKQMIKPKKEKKGKKSKGYDEKLLREEESTNLFNDQPKSADSKESTVIYFLSNSKSSKHTRE